LEILLALKIYKKDQKYRMAARKMSYKTTKAKIIINRK
jgi:hypothetical protein